MTIQEKIAANQDKWTKWRKAEAILRRIRLRIFDYEDAGKLAKAQRIIGKLQDILAPKWRAERAAAEDRKLQATPSAFEPGCR